MPFGLKILQTSHSSKFSIAFWTTFKAFWCVLRCHFSEKIERVKNILSSWSARRLTLLGKITIIKAFALSQIVHVLTSLPTHQDALKENNTLLYDFLWESKGDKIKRTQMINDYDKGGLKMIYIQSFNKLLNKKWVSGNFS